MNWEILHRTEYRYAQPVKESFNEVRLQPMSSEIQKLGMFSLNVQPGTRLQEYRDFYSNRVHYFEILEPHDLLVVESILEAHTLAPTLPAADAAPFALSRIAEVGTAFRCHDFLNPSRFVDVEPETWRLALDATNGLADAWQAAQAIMRFVNAHVTYASNSTSVHTHMRQVLSSRQGVCQDFAHVALGLYRSLKIPALYVSGYLATEKASATHAWIEVFIPELGWLGLDPTHARPVDESYLKIAVGRDYADVAPVSGHYKGTREHQMQVRLEIRTSA